MTEKEFKELERHFGAIKPEPEITKADVISSFFGAAAIILGVFGLFI